MEYLFLALGFVFLIKGADWLVEGAASLARQLKISDFVIGLTVVAFGTSAPELVVNLLASFSGSTDLAIGNVIGSNIANFLLVLGASGLFQTLHVERKLFKIEIPFAVLCAPVLILLGTGFFMSPESTWGLSRADGITLILAFVFFLYLTIKGAKGEVSDDLPEETLSTSKGILFFLLGLAGLILGGQWIVDSAVFIAKSYGLSESLIGLTIVAIGTSLPEVAASVSAAMKGKGDIAIGNVLGSNIFNVLWVLAVSSAINPIAMNKNHIIDISVAGLSGLLFCVLIMLFRDKSKKNGPGLFGKGSAIFFLILYVLYVIYLVMRG